MATVSRRLVLAAAAVGAAVLGAACGDTLVDHTNVGVRDQGSGGSTCTDPKAVLCQENGAPACRVESAQFCGLACEDCTTTVTAPAGGQAACLVPQGGHGACGFACGGGLLRTAGACEGAVALAAGAAHTCAITTSGALLCWGSNDEGQVTGTATAAPVAAPRVVFASGATAVAAGKAHTCAVVSGQLRCFGRNAEGQAPATRAGSAVALAAGDRHTCALVADGAVTCWGAIGLGQIGGGTPIAGGATALAAGADHTCALVGDGVSCWGTNAAGELGTGSLGGSSAGATTPLGLGAGIVAIGAGAHHTCAATGTRATPLRCWGANPSGPNGLVLPGLGTPEQPTPAEPQKGGPLIDNKELARIAGGRLHTCVQRPGESASCFGADNGAGQLGIGLPNELADSGMPPLATVWAIGGDHGCVVRDAGAVSCWGANGSGQLGDGSTATPAVGIHVFVSGR
jgi:hypothetical protein